MDWILLSCSDCKHHERIYDKEEKDNYSYCHKKKERLSFLERNWAGSWSDYEYTCFRPSHECNERLDKHYKKLFGAKPRGGKTLQMEKRIQKAKEEGKNILVIGKDTLYGGSDE